jgi:predicted SnoaL-like aldol condensation-catalyzing enzyme
MSSASQSLSIPEQNKQLVLRWFEEVWNQGRRETISELFAENGVIHDGPRLFRGPREFELFYDALQSQFTDFKITPIVSVAEDDRVALHWSCAARHRETQKDMSITGTSIVRVENGRFVEAWQNWDAAQMYTQITGQSILSF